MTNWPEMTQTLMETFALKRHPIGLHYQDTRPEAALGFKGDAGCLIALLKKIEGKSMVAISGDTGCFGGRFYCGFAREPRKEQAEFVSQREHYLKTPELCRRIWAEHAPPAAAGKWLVFQRLDTYAGNIEPEVVIFFAPPDSLAGLFGLANYDRGTDGVTARFSSGCGSIVEFPRIEALRGTHRAVLGMFDPSARAAEDPAILTFAVDAARLKEMAANIGECFLQHDAWKKIKERIARQ